MKNPIDTKCKEIIPIPIEQNLNTIVDKQKLPDERGIPTSSITRLEGQIITNHPNKDLNNHGCHLTEKQSLDHAKSIQHNRKSASNDAHQIESDQKCTEQSVDNRKGYSKNSISLSHQVVETHNSTNEGMSDVSSIEKHESNVLITTDSSDSNETSHFIHENDHNSSDKEMSQTDGVGVIDAKKSETNDDVICDKQHANNLELCDANVLISSNPRYDSVGNPIDTNDDLLATHGKLVTPGANSNSASNSHLNEIIPNCEGTLTNENRPRIICDKSESLLYHSSGHSTGDKLVAKEALKETIVNSNTKYQKNIIGFLRPFKSQKKEQGMRNCKSLVFDKMESEELLKDKHMAGSYGNLRKPTIQAAGNQRRRCISSSCENENKRYVALRNDFEEDIDEQRPNSPISNSKKTISLSTITLTKLRNNNQKIQRKIDNILTKSWRSILTVQNSRSSQDISDGSRGKPFYKNPYGTRSVINVNSNIIYKQPAYSKSWTEISGCMHETRKKNSGHYASNVCRQGAAPKSPLASSSSDEVIPESPMPRLAKLREFSSSASSVSGGPRSGSFSSEPLKPVNRLRIPSLCEDGAPSKMCSRCSSLLSMAASSKYSVSSLAGYVSVPAPVSSGEPVAGGSSGDVLCKVCLLEVPHKDSWTLSDCHCTYCLECVLQYVDFEIGQGAYQISCPDAACERQGLITLVEIQTLVSSEALEKHKRFRLNKEVDLDKSRTWCPAAGCDTICSLRVGGDRSAPQCVTCVTCSLDFCSLCRAPWHDNAPCNRSPTGGATFDSELIKCCPMCSVPIEKDEGCAQMLCKRCKHVFCWYCLASLDDDFLLRHYDKGPCKNKLGHSRASVIWHRTQVIGIFAGFGILLLVASPLLLLAAPCIVCCKCHVCTSGDSEEDLPMDLPGLEGETTPLNPSDKDEDKKMEENGAPSNSNRPVSASDVSSPK